jgi:hypothetical protein
MNAAAMPLEKISGPSVGMGENYIIQALTAPVKRFPTKDGSWWRTGRKTGKRSSVHAQTMSPIKNL